MRGRWLAALALAVGVVGCGGSLTDSGKWSDPTKITYYAGLHVDLSRMSRTASGVFYFDSIPGTGTVPAKPGDQVTVRYTLWLPDGTLIDNNGGVALNARLDPDSVIQGWVDGLTGVVQGTTRQLVIPPTLGYQSVQNGRIPANSTLVFLVAVDRVTPASSGDVVSVRRISRALVASGAAGRFPRREARGGPPSGGAAQRVD